MVSEGDLIRRGEPERQQRRDWWLEMLAEGETLEPKISARQLGGKEATARDLMSAPLVMAEEGTDFDGDRQPSHHAPDQTRACGPRRGGLVGIVSRADLLRAIAPAARQARHRGPRIFRRRVCQPGRLNSRRFAATGRPNAVATADLSAENFI